MEGAGLQEPLTNCIKAIALQQLWLYKYLLPLFVTLHALPCLAFPCFAVPFLVIRIVHKLQASRCFSSVCCLYGNNKKEKLLVVTRLSFSAKNSKNTNDMPAIDKKK